MPLHRSFFPFIALLLIMFTGCAGPLEVKYDPKTPGQFKSVEPSPVYVGEFADRRENADSANARTIGRIEATVSDISGSALTVSKDVTELVEEAYRKELSLSGFTVVDDIEKAMYTVEGEVREFRLDIGSRDEVAIEVASEFKDALTGQTLWKGAGAERGDRFAGVLGNSRTTISNYLAASLQKAVRGSIEAAGPRLQALVKAAPSVEATKDTPRAPGGTIKLNASPTAAKVYIDGVYFGLTPLVTGLAPGVYEVVLKQKGFRSMTEKVSIRESEVTELEAELEKE